VRPRRRRLARRRRIARKWRAWWAEHIARNRVWVDEVMAMFSDAPSAATGDAEKEVCE
jgi:hypothetical protein